LTGGQRTLYEQLRAGQHARVREALAQAGHASGPSRVLILDALLKLREVCCDPQLVANAPATARESAKMDLLMELVDDLLQGGRRMLIFSHSRSSPACSRSSRPRWRPGGSTGPG
jgi:SNF2 family DNA or RNA helicase